MKFLSSSEVENHDLLADSEILFTLLGDVVLKLRDFEDTEIAVCVNKNNNKKIIL